MLFGYNDEDDLEGVGVPALPVLPQASISLNASSAAEGNSGTVTWTGTVTLNSAAPAGNATGTWSVAGVGANPLNAADFGGSFPSGSWSVTAGATTTTFTFTTTGDTTVETDETGRLTIVASTNCTIAAGAVDFTLTNDDVSSLSYTVSVEMFDGMPVLAVRGTWAATTGSWRLPGNVPAPGDADYTNAFWADGGVDQFPLDASGTPKIELLVQDAGFDRVGGLPVANANRARTVVATKVLRRPWPNMGQLDEFDHGDGTRTIRFALSDRIYSTTTILSASFLSGWKAGQPGGVINTVANNSTRTPALPIFRWANEPWPLVQGTVGTPNHTARVELIIASHHPETVANSDGQRHQACAAIRLRAFDGTTTKDFFFSAPQTSTLYGDDLRCWGGEIDLSGLSAGPITVHATVYPWLGVERSTGTAHSTSITAALATAWGTPFHVFYDPDGTVWPRKYVAIDTASANTDSDNAAHVAAVLLYDSPAAAEAAPLSAKAANYNTALRKFRDAPTMPARNGFASVASCCAYWEILLPAGTHTPLKGVGATGPSAGPGYLIVSHVPSASDPRANVIFAGPGTRVLNGAVDRVKVRGIRVNFSATDFFSSRSGSWGSFENCNVRSTAGTQSSGGGFYQTEANTSAMQCDMRDKASNPRGWFARNVTRTAAHNTAAAACLIGVRIVLPEVGEQAPSRTANLAFAVGSSSDDLMIWNCEVYSWGNNLWSGSPYSFFAQGTALRRLAVVNSTFEGQGSTLQQTGETGAGQLQDSILENCTFVGGRWNLHNDNDIARAGASAPFRVNNSPTNEIEVGILNHGLTTGDTITTSGSTNANLNRTNVAVTVLDANRFRYVAAAAVTSVTGDQAAFIPSILVTSGARNGTTLTVLRDNLRHTGNVIRYSSFDRNATKHDNFNNAPNLTGSWEILYGVGYRGNVNANRGVATPADFQYAFYGIGSSAETDFGPPVASLGVNWHGYVDDNSPNGPDNPTPTYNGDYRADTITLAPFKPSRLLGKGNAPAVIDRDAQNVVRTNSFPGGGRGSN